MQRRRLMREINLCSIVLPFLPYLWKMFAPLLRKGRPSHVSLARLLAQFSTGAEAAAPGSGIIEVREYNLHPQGVKDYLKLSTESATVRQKLLPFLGCVARRDGAACAYVMQFRC